MPQSTALSVTMPVECKKALLQALDALFDLRLMAPVSPSHHGGKGGGAAQCPYCYFSEASFEQHHAGCPIGIAKAAISSISPAWIDRDEFLTSQPPIPDWDERLMFLTGQPFKNKAENPSATPPDGGLPMPQSLEDRISYLENRVGALEQIIINVFTMLDGVRVADLVEIVTATQRASVTADKHDPATPPEAC